MKKFILKKINKGEGKVGTYGFTVNVANKGLAQMNSASQYRFELTADGFTPSQAGTGGINDIFELIFFS